MLSPVVREQLAKVVSTREYPQIILFDAMAPVVDGAVVFDDVTTLEQIFDAMGLESKSKVELSYQIPHDMTETSLKYCAIMEIRHCPEYPQVHHKRDGYYLIQIDGSSRYLTFWESVRYRLSGKVPQ